MLFLSQMTASFLGRFAPPLTLGVIVFSSLLNSLAGEELVEIRMSDNGDFLVPLLADHLGYFRMEGLSLTRRQVTDVAPEDFLMQQALIAGKLDASYHWFQHTVYGVRHNLPVTAVMLLNDAPGAKVMVANRVRDQIKSAADFSGKHVAEGMAYATKGMLTNLLTIRAGLPRHSYIPVFPEEAGRQKAVIEGLQRGQVDVATFLEPMTSAVEATGLVSTLYDLTSRAGTIKAFGAPYPGQCILMAPSYIKAHPQNVQHVVNAMVRAMRYINAHSAAEIAAQLPSEYFKSLDHQAELHFIQKTLPTFAQDDYSFPPEGVQLVIDTILNTDFDSSPEGIWRRTVDNPTIIPTDLYTNRFVSAAMTAIK